MVKLMVSDKKYTSNDTIHSHKHYYYYYYYYYYICYRLYAGYLQLYTCNKPCF